VGGTRRDKRMTITDETWKPTYAEFQRAKNAGVIDLRHENGKPVCGHGLTWWRDCPDCHRAILDYERQQGREPTDTEANAYNATTGRLDDLQKELQEAGRKLALAEGGPAGGVWRPLLNALVAAGIVFAISRAGLPEAISAAVFFVIFGTYRALDQGRRHSLIVREARHRLEELKRHESQLHDQLLSHPQWVIRYKKGAGS
jgi:hypothetical protein